MEGILNLLRKLGYSENEIKTVLNKVPVEEQGLMGTNVATGIFSKPKEGKLAKDFLVSDVIGNPFEIDYYKGRSREDILKSAEAQLNMINDELLKISYQIVNKNLKLTDDQLRNFSKNLEAKRRFEKDFEAFKTKPEAEVLDIETGKKVGDIETLKEKSGLVAPPTTDLGRIDLRNKQMLQKADEFFKSQEEVEKAEAKRQALIAKQYEGKGYEGGVFGPSGMYRSVARNFLLDQHAKGKIKLTEDVIKNLEERNYISGGQPLMYPDPIRIMRLHYGDDVFEKIPLDKIKTGAPSEITEEMSKININPVKVEAPATPGGYMTPGEIKANIQELENIERMIKRRESRFADMTDEQIKNELEHYGSQKNAFEIAFGYDHPKEYEEYLKLKNLEDPKKFAKGGSVESLGLDYLTGIERDYPGRSNFKEGSIPKMLKFLIDKLADEKDFNRKLLERSNPKAVQDLYIEKYGKLPSAEEIKDIVNKQLQNKGSMEVMNPKTGEVTIPKEPVKVTEEPRTLGGLPIDERSANISDEIDKLRASGINSLENEKKLNRLSLEFVDSLDPRRQKKALDYRRESLDTENKLIIKAEEEGLDFNTYEKLRQGLYGLGKQKTLNFIKTGKVDLEPLKPVTTFEEAQKRFKTAAKAADEIFPDYNQPKTAASSLAEVMAEQKYGKVFDDISGDKQQELYEEAYNYITSINKLPKQSPAIIPEQVLEAEMNRVLNQYDKSMFIKNDQGMVDVTNPENVQKMALLLKRDHPELYRRLEAGMSQEKSTMTPTLEEFKKTSPEAYGEFSKSTNRMQELLNFRSGQETFETFDLETYNYLSSQEIGRLLNQLKNPYKISDKERNLVRTGFTRDNMEGTGLKNFDEINFRTDKKQLETYLDDLYNKKQVEEAQIELSDLQDSGREPNANGGRIGYAEGSEGAPSITLDTHDKAPDNMDKYPIKAGNLELGISGLMTEGKSYQANPYNKITGSERNFSVRGKYNVPDTGVSFLGDIGDVRMRNTQNINAPQYNYKETIRDVMKANPYSVGIEYAPDQNRNINLRYDDQGNVSLRGEYKFAKGGLGYLVGE